MTEQGRNFLSALAMAITIGAFLPYIRGILRETIHPHVCSWGIWGVVTVIVGVAQVHGGGGPGAWVIGFSAFLSLMIAGLAFRSQGDRTVTRTDMQFAGAALCSLPIWWVTDDAMWSVILLTGIDILGFGPTVRTAWMNPERESAAFFAVVGIRNCLVVAALDRWSVVTVTFPLAMAVVCFLVVGILLLRRRRLKIGLA
jgi:hypothetical protein